MKKVLVAGAALMLAGSIVSAAYAEVNLSGDARVRYIYKDNYDFGNSDQSGADKWDSRVRVNFNAKAKGGAFMKARIRFDDITWDGQGWNAYQDDKNIYTDYAVIGIPMGPVTVSGGRQEASYTKFFSWDGRPTRFKVDYKSDVVRVIGVIDVKDEDGITQQDTWDDNDFMGYGLIGVANIGEDWMVKGYIRYHDDQRGAGLAGYQDASGWLGSVHTAGKAGPVGIEAELAYKGSDVQGTKDDGWGGYALASFDMGAFVPAAMIGFTKDGYLANKHFGFIMTGGDEPITVVTQVGGATNQDWTWAAFIGNYTINEQFKLAGNVAYVSVDNNDNAVLTTDNRLANAWELSGSATYVISEGADFTWKIGYLQPDFDGRLDGIGVQDDGAFGTYGRLQIKF